MQHIIQVDISRTGRYFIAEGVDVPLVTQARTLKELTKNLEEIIELHLAKDPDEGLELTAQARRRLMAAKKMISSGKYKSVSFDEIKKKYL